jgi:adenylate cyclase
LSSEQPKQGFQLADWQVRPALSELERDGMVVQLEPRVMAVLETLASKPGEVFSREELERQVWQGSVIGYDALAKAINKLREALGDDKKDPRYIQTLSKKGYRLVAEVSLETGTTSRETTQTGANDTANNISSTTRSRLLVGGVFIAFLVTGLLLFLLTGDRDQQAPVIKPATLNDHKPTIVVLPFRNISPDDKDDYLADGLTSDLITSLSKLSGLWVTSSSATRAYKGIDVTPEKIQQEFNARYVISGEVNKIARAIRINVHLTDIDSGNILWAERYDRQITDLFAIQDEVTQKILENLSLTLTQEEKQRLAKRYTHNIKAYEYFLRGQSLINFRTPEDNTTAREMYYKAIELDPSFGRAYAGVAMTYAIGFNRKWPSDANEPLQKSLELASQAIKLDKDLAESYWVASFVNGNQQKTDEAIEMLNHALALNPNYADAYAMLAWLQISTGKPEQAIESMDNAYRLNPSGGFLYDMQLARANYYMENYDLALTYLVKSKEVNPIFIDTIYYMAATYARIEQYDEAGWMINEAKHINPDLNAQTWLELHPVRNKTFREKLHLDLLKAEKYSKQ